MLLHPAITLAVLLATIGLNVYLFMHVPKGFFRNRTTDESWGRFKRPGPSFRQWTGSCCA